MMFGAEGFGRCPEYSVSASLSACRKRCAMLVVVLYACYDLKPYAACESCSYTAADLDQRAPKHPPTHQLIKIL